MSVRITDNTHQVEGLLTLKASIFLRSMADEIVKIATPNTPKDTGDMRRSIVKQVLGLKGAIKWGKNYAIYQEKIQFKNYTTPGTGPNFALNSAKKGITRTGSVARRAGLI